MWNLEFGLRSWLFAKGEVPLTNGRKSNLDVNKRIIISKKMIRHEMLAFYKALYSVCLRPYASKFPTAFIQKEFPSFVWCISCLISENNVLMHQCANKRKGYQSTLWTLRFEIWTLWLHSMLLLSFIRTHRLRRLRPLGQWPLVQYSIFNIQ